MPEYTRIGRPGYIGSRKEEVHHNYDTLYGKGDWRFVWDVKGHLTTLEGALLLYEDAYAEHFRKHPAELREIAANFEDVYDNHPSNVHSGLDYRIQDFEGNHFQDIAIRRCLVRNGLWFRGNGLLEIRSKGEGKKWSPSEIPFSSNSLFTRCAG